MATRRARVLRGLVASSVAVFIAAFAHVLGGGAVPDAGGLALAFAFATLMCIALAGRTVSRVRVSASVILSQGVFHVFFDLTGPTHVMHTTHTMGMAMGSAMPNVTTAPLMLDDGWMWVAHGIAAAITIGALVWGERAFWGLWQTARLALTRALRVARVLPESARPALPRTPREPVTQMLAVFLDAGPRRRGPPATLIASC
jgi:hypothetical protein